LTFAQSTSQIEAGGIRESLYFRNQRVKKNVLGGQRSRNEKCLYSSREYVYKVSLSSDGPKPIIFLKKKKNNYLGGQRSRNEKCLYSSKEYVYKVLLSSDGPKQQFSLNKKKKKK
jgi:hypothetical protein